MMQVFEAPPSRGMPVLPADPPSRGSSRSGMRSQPSQPQIPLLRPSSRQPAAFTPPRPASRGFDGFVGQFGNESPQPTVDRAISREQKKSSLFAPSPQKEVIQVRTKAAPRETREQREMKEMPSSSVMRQPTPDRPSTALSALSSAVPSRVSTPHERRHYLVKDQLDLTMSSSMNRTLQGESQFLTMNGNAWCAEDEHRHHDHQHRQFPEEEPGFDVEKHLRKNRRKWHLLQRLNDIHDAAGLDAQELFAIDAQSNPNSRPTTAEWEEDATSAGRLRLSRAGQAALSEGKRPGTTTSKNDLFSTDVYSEFGL